MFYEIVESIIICKNETVSRSFMNLRTHKVDNVVIYKWTSFNNYIKN